MFGLDTKSLIIGLAIGYFLLPRLVAPILGKISAKTAPAAK